MRMKEVRELTGLTDRAIRLYIDEELIAPAVSENYLGRKTLEFSQEDVKQLSDISILRQFGFSIAQIRAIQNDTKAASFILDELRTRKQDIILNEQAFLAAISKVNVHQNCNIAELADALRGARIKSSKKPDNGNSRTSDIVRGFLAALFWGMLFLVGTVLLVLLIDMAVFYYKSNALTLNTAGLKDVISRSGEYLFAAIGLIAIIFPVKYCWGILKQYGLNWKYPEITIPAVVVDKKQSADSVVLSSFYARNGGMIDILIFRTATGEILELTVPRSSYYKITIGTKGILRFQGSKMESFVQSGE